MRARGGTLVPIIDNLFDAKKLVEGAYFYYRADKDGVPLSWWKVGDTAESPIGFIVTDDIKSFNFNEEKKEAKKKCKNYGYCYDEIFIRSEPLNPIIGKLLYSLTFRLFLPKTREAKRRKNDN